MATEQAVAEPPATEGETTAESLESPAAEPDESTGFADSGFESASENLDDPVEAQLAALTDVVKQQNELLERQQHTIERLIEELSRGR